MRPCIRLAGASPRTDAISSTSSMNTRTRSRRRIRSNVARRAAAGPAGSASSALGSTSTNGQPSLLAIARANDVFPVPGGPNSTIALGGATP